MASSLLAVDDNIDEFSDFESAQTLDSLESEILEDSTKILCGSIRSETHPHNCSGESNCHDSLDPLKGSDASNTLEDFIANNDISQLLQDTFPCPDNSKDVHVEIRDLDQHCTSHWLWSKLEEVDCITQQQWEDTRAFQLMLHSLKIDSRNILQMCVTPRHFTFRSNQLCCPEQFFAEAEAQYDLTGVEVFIPISQFDWICSGMTNPLEDELCLLDTIGDEPSVKERVIGDTNSTAIQNSKENGNLKVKLPDLSFMQSKVLSVPFQKILSHNYKII